MFLTNRKRKELLLPTEVEVLEKEETCWNVQFHFAAFQQFKFSRDSFTIFCGYAYQTIGYNPLDTSTFIGLEKKVSVTFRIKIIEI